MFCRKTLSVFFALFFVFAFFSCEKIVRMNKINTLPYADSYVMKYDVIDTDGSTSLVAGFFISEEIGGLNENDALDIKEHSFPAFNNSISALTSQLLPPSQTTTFYYRAFLRDGDEYFYGDNFYLKT